MEDGLACQLRLSVNVGRECSYHLSGVIVKNRPYAIGFILLISSTPSIRCEEHFLGKTVFSKDFPDSLIGEQVAHKYNVLAFPTHFCAGIGERLGLGLARIKKSDVMNPQQALEYFDLDIEKDRNTATPLLDRAMAQRPKGELKGAIMDFDDALLLDSPCVKVRCYRGISKTYPTIKGQEEKRRNESRYVHFVFDYQFVVDDPFG